MKKYKEKIICVLVFAFILLIGLKFCNDKNGYHLDEVYTHVLANSEYAPWIVDIKEGKIVNTVVSRQELLDAVTVNENDRFCFGSVYYNQTQDVHPPLYYFVMHAMSSICVGAFSKWIGLGLNISLFAGTLLLLYSVINKYFGGYKNANFIVLVYGLSSIALSTLVFIRMYMMLTFFTLLLAYFILRQMIDGKKCYFAIALTVFCGMLTQYYFVIYAFCVCLSYMIYLVVKKEYKETIWFSMSALLGVASMLGFFPHFVTQLSLQETVSMDKTVRNLNNVQQYWKRFITMGQDVAPDMIVAIVGVVVFMVLYVIKLKQHKSETKSLKTLVVIIPAYISYVVVCIIAPYVTDRYVYHLIPVMILFLGFLMDNTPDKKIGIKGENIYYIGLFTVAIFSVGCLKMNQPNYVYDYSAYNMIVEDNSSYPCIFVSENDHAPITSAIPQLLYFDEFMVINDKTLESVDEYIKNSDEKEVVVIFKESLPTNMDETLIIEKMNGLGYSQYDQIYTERFYNIYLFY